MVAEKEKSLSDFLKLVCPGTPLRSVIDDLVKSDLGAMIVFDSPELHNQDMFEGGFRVNCRFTPQKLFELCKMDGAIIVSSDLKRILYANVLMTPSKIITSSETGTRHINSEKVAKQAKTFVIAVSERRKKTTLYYCSSKYFLKTSEELIRNISSNMQVLEKNRESLDSLIKDLNILEMSNMVSVIDVCRVLQRTCVILKVSEAIKRNFIELGREGSVINFRYKELIKNVDKIESDVLRDYSSLSLKKSKKILENLTMEGVLELESIARLIFEKNLDEPVKPKGYRFLSHLPLSVKEIDQVVKEFKNLEKIFDLQDGELEALFKNRAESIKKEIQEIREQILSGKVIS